MPTVLPDAPPGTSLVVALTMVLAVALVIAGFVVADVTSSTGWGFVAAGAVLLVGVAIVGLALRRVQRATSAARLAQHDEPPNA